MNALSTLQLTTARSQPIWGIHMLWQEPGVQLGIEPMTFSFGGEWHTHYATQAYIYNYYCTLLHVISAFSYI